MKKYLLVFGFMGTFVAAQASEVRVEIKSLTNAARSTVLEACGTADDDQGSFPIAVTVTHDGSSYTTLTDPSGKWCVLVKRWTMSGKVGVSGTRLLQK